MPPPPAPSPDQGAFQMTLYPLVTDPMNFCVSCHSAAVEPTFASTDPTIAYNAIVGQQKVSLTNPELSRVYVRPKDNRHNCGGVASCDRIAADFLIGIQNWANMQIAGDPPPGSVTPVVSAMTSFADAMDGGIARADDNAIALFTFAEGAGTTTTDTSGAGAPIALQIEGMEWADGGGLRNISGKAQASAADSRKIFDMIAMENQYSVEAWIIPDNTAQDGPARIVSYSGGTQVRNFTLGQNAIYYQLRNRSVGTGANGTPALEALDPQVATNLTHVVATFDTVVGRRLYINGQLALEEGAVGDSLDWQEDQIFVLGNETTNDRIWQGVFRLVAIHNKALTSAEVQQNFDAGTGNVVTMRFDLSAAVGAPAYVDFKAAEIDGSGYLFAEPTITSDAPGLAVRNIRIGVNGEIPVAEQSFRRIDTIVNQPATLLSPLGAIVPSALGADQDQFHLEFERLGSATGRTETVLPSIAPAPVPDTPEPDRGVRTFAQINDTMSVLTGVDANQDAIRPRFDELRGSLPATTDLLAFSAAQQIAIQRLATSYCDAAVSDSGSCNALFGTCSIDGAGKAQTAGLIYDRFIGTNLAEQPDRTAVTTEIVSLIDDLGCAGGCNGAAGEDVLKAACAAVLSSAAVTVN